MPFRQQGTVGWRCGCNGNHISDGCRTRGHSNCNEKLPGNTSRCRNSVDSGTVLPGSESGARFIVSPGFDAEIVDWCLEHDVAVIPGCTTPTEIMAAVKREIYTLKYFPANIYGGLAA